MSTVVTAGLALRIESRPHSRRRQPRSGLWPHDRLAVHPQPLPHKRMRQVCGGVLVSYSAALPTLLLPEHPVDGNAPKTARPRRRPLSLVHGKIRVRSAISSTAAAFRRCRHLVYDVGTPVDLWCPRALASPQGDGPPTFPRSRLRPTAAAAATTPRLPRNLICGGGSTAIRWPF